MTLEYGYVQYKSRPLIFLVNYQLNFEDQIKISRNNIFNFKINCFYLI